MVPRAGSRRAEAAGHGGAYLPTLDGLRAVSILLVVLSHLGLDRVVPGAFGVTLFFFISGFLITRQLAGGLARQGRVDFGGFYWRRVLRLMPAGLVYIAVAGLVFTAVGGVVTTGGWLAALGYGANYYDLWAGYRSSVPGVRHPFNILWSLAIEEHFYALWPVCLALTWRLGWGKGRVFWALAVLCGAVLVWRMVLWQVCFGAEVWGGWGVCGPANPNPVWRTNRLYLATDTRLDSIAWGAMLALADGRVVGARSGRTALLGLVVLVAGFALPGPFARHVVRPSLQGAALLWSMPWLLSGESVVHRGLRSAPARLLGRLSYSLYLWHWAALGVADWFFAGRRLAWLLVAVPLSLGLAGASYGGIERPMLAVRRRFGSQVN